MNALLNSSFCPSNTHLYLETTNCFLNTYVSYENETLPSKKSNLAILDEKILSLLENPRQFWESINTKQKRRLQDVLFPDGLHYSPKTTEYRTSNIHLLLEITGCFIDTWNSEKNKTRRQNVFGSRVVDILEKRSKLKQADKPNQIERIIGR